MVIMEPSLSSRHGFQALRLLLAGLFALAGFFSSPARATAAAYVSISPITRNAEKSAATLLIAKGGRPMQPVTISVKASAPTRAVAGELAGYLKRITGASFEVRTGDGSSGIVLGTLTDFPTPALNPALAIRNGFDGKEAYAIRTQPKRLLLLAATDKGVPHVAFRFLEDLGCRWFFPHPAWEVVPTIPTLKFGRDITDRPTILSRSIWFEAGSGGDQQNADYVNWKRHNGQAESFVSNAGHNMDVVTHLHQAEFDKHPEYFALRKQADGTFKRDLWSGQLELSNPAVRKMIVDYAVDYFKQNPVADMVSLEPADTTAHSESPESLALGSVSDNVFGMANEAAKALQAAYPGQNKLVGVLSYNAHWDPPSFPLEPNVHVQLSGLGQGKYTGPERDALWPQRSHNLGFYEYFSVWLWSYDHLPGSWTNGVHGLQKGIQDRVARGATAVSAESTSSWGPNGRGYYVTNKLLWNPDADVNALVADFYEKAFGPGAPAMKRYYERLDPDGRLFMSGHLLGLSFQDVNEASLAAKGRPDVQARLDQIKLYLRYVQLDWMRNHEGLPEDQKAANWTAIMTNLYRSRPYALTSWEMIRQQWGGNKYPGRDQADWMVDKPYTHAEIEADFQDGLKHFAAKIRMIGPQLTFSTDLVPVRWPQASPTGIESRQYYQGPLRYLLYSLHGEPLVFTTEAGDAWGGINRFTVTDARGVEIAKGQPKNKETTPHSITVPGPGLYTLDYNDGGSYWNMTVPAGAVATIPLGQTSDYRNSKVMQDTYFYVPKGTKTIEYYYTRTAFHPGGPHQVLDPEGKVRQAVDVNGDYVTVPVPVGMDGKLWRFHEPVLGLFWFNDVPNYFAASPEALLVPREVALRDALEILR